MAVFVAPQPDIEVTSDCIEAILNCMKRSRTSREEILKKYGLLNDNMWHCFQTWLNAFKDISLNMGERNLFLIGITFINKLDLEVGTTLKQALEFINIAYHSKHRLHGQILYNDKDNTMIDAIGNYSLISYDEKKCEAIIKSTTPYPSKFDEGLIYEVARKYKPNPTRAHIISLDLSSETREHGATSCTYVLSW